MEPNVFSSNDNTFAYEEEIKWLTIAFSSASLICCIIVISLSLKDCKGLKFAHELMFYVACSEIVNSVSKCLFLNYISSTISKGDSICISQVFLGVFSDYFTLVSTALISIKIYDTVALQSSIFNELKVRNITRVCCFGIPLSASLFFGFDYMFNRSDSPRDDPLWCWVDKERNIIVYISYVCIIIITTFFSIKSIIILKKQKENALIQNNAVSMVNTEEASFHHDYIIHIAKSIKKLYVYPIVSISIWAFLFIDRLLMLLRYDEKGIDMLRQVFHFLHCIICSSRGIFYSFCYLGYGVIQRCSQGNTEGDQGMNGALSTRSTSKSYSHT